jgi:hypothetical protein
MKNRYKKHYHICYSENDRHYNTKLYITIRQLQITKKQFKEYVKYEILYENIPAKNISIMENLIINLYREWGINLFNEKNGLLDIDKIKNYRKEWRETNKDDIKQKKKIYYQENKMKINKQNKEYIQLYNSTKIKCPICNLEMNRGSLLRHTRRKH